MKNLLNFIFVTTQSKRSLKVEINGTKFC